MKPQQSNEYLACNSQLLVSGVEWLFVLIMNMQPCDRQQFIVVVFLAFLTNVLKGLLREDVIL